MKTLVYIASVGYSGSTLLDMLLGGSSEITSLGEVHSLAKHAIRDAVCTCGEPISQCDFWRAVEEELRKESGDPHLDLASFSLSVSEKTRSLDRRLPNLADLLLVVGNPIAWRALSRLSPISRGYARASANALQLFEAVSRVAGTPIIVDSSKYPLPMKSLYLADPERVRIIYLVRDGRAVSRSLMNRQDLSLEEAARRWTRFNWNLELVMRTISARNVLRVRYEDFCRNPSDHLTRLSEFVGTANPIPLQPLHKDRFHNIGGNPMRFRRGETKIVLDEKWKDELTTEQLGTFEAIGGKLNRRLGYT